MNALTMRICQRVVQCHYKSLFSVVHVQYTHNKNKSKKMMSLPVLLLTLGRTCENRGGAYKTFWVWDWFRSQAFFQSLFEQSLQYLAYMWLESMLKLQIGQILTVKFWPIWSLSMNLISDSKSFISTATGVLSGAGLRRYCYSSDPF